VSAFRLGRLYVGEILGNHFAERWRLALGLAARSRIVAKARVG
jgi:hypothetical protein